MKAKLLSALKYLLFLSFGILILYVVFKDKDLDKMLEDLRSAEYKWLIFSMLFGYAAYIFRGLRWVQLIEAMKYKATANHATHAIAAGYFANALFPRAGEVVRCTSLYKATGIPVNKLFGTILLERAIDLVEEFVRIHGTTAPQSIGTPSSNGCIRMTNWHIEQLYQQVPLGTEVIVISGRE